MRCRSRWLVCLFFLACVLASTAQELLQPNSVTDVKNRQDSYGDSLPEGAVLRIGTVRMRQSGNVSAVVFSPDGNVIASAGDSDLVLWAPRTGKDLYRLPCSGPAGVTFSHDGKIIVAYDSNDSIHVWDVKSGKTLNTFRAGDQGGWVWKVAVALSPDGTRLMFTGSDGTAQVRRLTDGKKLLHFKLQQGDAVSALAFSRDGKLLASATRYVTQSPESGPGPVCVWDTSTGKEVFRLNRHKHSPVWTLTISPDGSRLLTPPDFFGEPPTLWDTASGKKLTTLEAGKGSQFSECVAFSHDGKIIAIPQRRGPVGSPGSVGLWDAATGKSIGLINTPFPGASSIAFSPDDKTLVAGIGSAIHLIEASSGKEITPQSGPTSPIHFLAHLDEKNNIAVGTNKTIWKYDLSTGKAIGQIWIPPEPFFNECRFVALSPDTKNLAVLPGKAVADLFDATTGNFIRTTQLPWGGAQSSSVSFSADGKALATCNGGGVCVEDVATGETIFKLTGDCAAYSPDGKCLAVGANGELPPEYDGSIRIHDAQSGKEIKTLRQRARFFWRMAFSPDSNTLAVALSYALDQHELCLWNVASARHRRFSWPGESSAFTFSPDGSQLALSGKENSVRLMDVATGKIIRTLSGHRGPVRSLLFSKDGKRLISGSDDATALVWDLDGTSAQK